STGRRRPMPAPRRGTCSSTTATRARCRRVPPNPFERCAAAREQGVICASCGHDNPAAARFCNGCGAALAPRCPACGSGNPAGARFCNACGAVLAPQTPKTGDARKVVTILFADLAGSTALHERLDPESVRRLMERYYATVRAAIEVHGGTVVKLLGDGVMAAFGVPRVAEDDAVRAVHAAVAIAEGVRALDVSVRVAVNTGEVVVGA